MSKYRCLKLRLSRRSERPDEYNGADHCGVGVVWSGPGLEMRKTRRDDDSFVLTTLFGSKKAGKVQLAANRITPQQGVLFKCYLNICLHLQHLAGLNSRQRFDNKH